MFDLHFQTERERLAATIAADVETDTIAEYEEGPRSHLGASIIGHECERYLWNAFRWLKNEKFDGQKHRLFKRGHFEEPKFVHRLRRIGFQVFEHDANGTQYRIDGVKGHFGGSLDSVFVAPERYGIADALLGEYKTHGEKSYAKLAGPITSKWPVLVRDKSKAEGVRKSKPQHYSQMCSYGKFYGLKYALYCAVNKNTDELYFEIVELDWNLASDLYGKAERVVGSQTPPPGISLNPAFFTCKVCVYNPICHAGEAPEKNCRSCEHAFAIEGGQWYCRVHEGTIPKEFIPLGCDNWRRIV